MPDYGKIPWKPTKKTDKVDTSKRVNALVDFCKDKIPVKSLLKSCSLFIEEKTQLHDTHQNIIEKIACTPFLATFIVWTKEIASLRTDLLDAAQVLVEQGYIGITDTKNNAWTIEAAREFDHSTVLDTIRSQKNLTLFMRESLVTTYINFMQWLSDETHGYIERLEDPDLIRIRGRALEYLRFIKFLDALKEKEQLVAKLLYFGGTRILDEVLDLQIENVDFEKKLIQYNKQLVSYPGHIFSDIKAIAEKKMRGQLFLGRQNAALNPATIFRNFKEAALKVGFEQSFSPAVLILNT